MLIWTRLVFVLLLPNDAVFNAIWRFTMVSTNGRSSLPLQATRNVALRKNYDDMAACNAFSLLKSWKGCYRSLLCTLCFPNNILCWVRSYPLLFIRRRHGIDYANGSDDYDDDGGDDGDDGDDDDDDDGDDGECGRWGDNERDTMDTRGHQPAVSWLAQFERCWPTMMRSIWLHVSP